VDRKSVINDCCNNVSTLHRFRDITTFTTAQIKGHGCFPIHICVNIRSVLPVLWMTSSDRNKRLGKTDGSTWAGRLFKVTHRGQQGFDTVSYMHYWNWLARGSTGTGAKSAVYDALFENAGWRSLEKVFICSPRRKKVAHTRLPSVGFQSWSRFLAVSLQVTWVINPTAGCHYFPPGLQLPSQPLRGLQPILLLGEQRHNGCEQFAYKTITRQHRDCDLNSGPSAPESSTLTTRLQSHRKH